MKMRKTYFFLISALLLLGNYGALAQVRDSVAKVKITKPARVRNTIDTTKAHFNDSIRNQRRKDSIARLKVVAKPVIRDTMKRTVVLSPVDSSDTSLVVQNSTFSMDSITPFSVLQSTWRHHDITDSLLMANRFVNVKDASVFYIQQERTPTGKEFLFYTMCIIVLILGIFKTFFYGYFNNLFRVFFNTSLRQSQLTDQLLQAKLPSFILNIFFIITAGIYIWLLFTHFNPPRLISPPILLPICILSVATVYVVKYLLIKFMGWVSGIQHTTDNYIFIIFLINKITGILLIPFIILLAFARHEWIGIISTISLLLVGLFFLVRYAKSYGTLERKFPLNPFHFIIYVLGAEIFPLLIIYKVAMDYLV